MCVVIRYQPIVGWGSSYPGHLLPTDRSCFSDESGWKTVPGEKFDDIQPKDGFEWCGDFAKDLTYTDTDEEGFTYAFDFPILSSDFRTGKTKVKAERCVDTQCDHASVVAKTVFSFCVLRRCDRDVALCVVCDLSYLFVMTT